MSEETKNSEGQKTLPEVTGKGKMVGIPESWKNMQYMSLKKLMQDANPLLSVLHEGYQVRIKMKNTRTKRMTRIDKISSHQITKGYG